MKITDNFFLLIFMLIPILLITGPALPDISITLCALYFLINFIILKKDYNFLKDNFFLVSVMFWFSIIFISFFAFDKTRSFQDSIIFIRLLIIPTIGYFLFFQNIQLFFLLALIYRNTFYQILLFLPLYCNAKNKY